MNRKKPTKAIYIMLIIFILIILNIMFTVTIRGEDTSAWHRFKGYATDNTLKPIRDGVIITAIVVNVNGSTETYTTTVNNSLTGKNYDFYVEDPGADNNGRPIYFYIGNENTSQSVIFTSGGLNVNWSTYYNLTIDDIPKIIDNTPINGTTGDPFTFNITIIEYVDSADELTVKVNWTHGSLSGNDTMIPTGGSNINGFYFETTITLDDCESTLNYTIFVNDTSGNHNSSGPHDVAVIDNDPPQTTLEIGSPRYNNFVTTSTPIYLNTTDNCSNWYIHYRIWNENTGWSSWYVGNQNESLITTFSEEGKHYIEYYANDTSVLNNTEMTHNETYYVDDTSPTTNLIIGSPKYPSSPVDGCNVTSSTVFTLSASDNPTAHNSSVAFTWYTIDGDYHLIIQQLITLA